ncbi:MAG TPA: ATP-binding protein [Bryobacteraceae bacterium]|nr:ATP-binding protein [Bryobacteraceae bacterium]
MYGILMVSLMTDLVQRQQVFLMEKARAQIMRQAELLAASTTPQLITNDLAGLDDVLTSVRRDAAVQWVAVTDAKGLVKGDSDHSRQGKYYVDETSRAVLTGKTARMIRQTDLLLSAAAPVMVDDQVLGWAWISRDLSAERAQIAQLRRTGYTYTTFAILVGTLLAAILANQITRQLRLLLAGTKRLAEDRLDVPVPVVTDNDVGVVARAFNDALMRLESARLEIRKTQANLEGEIRERREAEARLQDVNRALVSANEGLTDFAHAASHDLQEPLRSVTGYSELLQRRYAGKLDTDADEFLSYVHDGARRMQRMIEALLHYARAGSQGPETQTDVDCGQALQMALENLEIAIETAEAKIHAEALPRVSAHDVAVVQLFQNLIGNAIKYAGPQTPEIWIRASRGERFWTISVRDNGMGIPAEQHKRIFGIFKRAHGKNYAGAGVGLAICAKIVERYGGSISVTSEVGKGAEFRFTLPPARSEAAKDAAQVQPQPAAV